MAKVNVLLSGSWVPLVHLFHLFFHIALRLSAPPEVAQQLCSVLLLVHVAPEAVAFATVKLRLLFQRRLEEIVPKTKAFPPKSSSNGLLKSLKSLLQSTFKAFLF